jgi:N-acetylglucosamine-6-sulfatase
VEAATELGGTVVPLLSGDQLPEDWRNMSRQDWGRPGLEAIRTEDNLYVEYDTGERELYDLKDDPNELDNRYKTADPEYLRRLRGRLAALRGCSAAACRAAEDGH